MSNQKLVKQYTVKNIEEIAKDFKYVSLEDVNGSVKMGWNSLNTAKYPEHLKNCIKRFNSQSLENGFYYFCFANATRLMKSPDRFLICKGDTATMHHPTINIEGLTSQKDMLTFDKALGYITQIANLTASNSFLTGENERLKKEVQEMEAELEVYESEKDGLSEIVKPSGTETYLKEISPSILAFADKWLTQRDRDQTLKERELNLKENKPTVKREIKKLETGSDEHLKYIKTLFDTNNEDLLNRELDKLESEKPELYEQICTELGIDK